ncbi:transcriptional regulator ATRX homolog isoform X2 [Prorops nasuta]|uniref:transcriptional regulator ATRX homolog isoform X2 n=1 Tax=Prorops nasuta TaxID=863751 RepID=UPI0034CFFE48
MARRRNAKQANSEPIEASANDVVSPIKKLKSQRTAAVSKKMENPEAPRVTRAGKINKQPQNNVEPEPMKQTKTKSKAPPKNVKETVTKAEGDSTTETLEAKPKSRAKKAVVNDVAENEQPSAPKRKRAVKNTENHVENETVPEKKEPKKPVAKKAVPKESTRKRVKAVPQEEGEEMDETPAVIKGKKAKAAVQEDTDEIEPVSAASKGRKVKLVEHEETEEVPVVVKGKRKLGPKLEKPAKAPAKPRGKKNQALAEVNEVVLNGNKDSDSNENMVDAESSVPQPKQAKVSKTTKKKVTQTKGNTFETSEAEPTDVISKPSKGKGKKEIPETKLSDIEEDVNGHVSEDGSPTNLNNTTPESIIY